MGAEDEGTPPAEQDGLLASEVASPVYRVRDTHRRPGWGTGGISQQPAKRPVRDWKGLMVPSGQDADSLDLVKLLEENWFWRSSTASPSMAETSTSYSHSTVVRPPHRQSQQQQDASSRGQRDSANDRSTARTPEHSCSATPFAASQMLSKERGSCVGGAQGSQQHRCAMESRRAQSADLNEQAVSHNEGLETKAHSYAQGACFQTRLNLLADPDPTVGDPLGTWAQRVFRFAPERKPSEPTHIPGTPEVAELHPRAKQQAEQRNAIPEADEEGDDEEAALEAAWRWRFNRRWRTEQAKQLDPEFGMDGDDEDGWDTALGYLDACGPGYHLQIARTTSVDKHLGASMKSSSGSFGNFLMDDSQKEKSELKEQAEMDATKSLVAVARKARDLYEKQQKIEKDVQQRWGDTKVSMAWAGQYLSAVKIDSYGRFPFILAKVSDRTTAHRLLVRGRNDTNKIELMNSLTSEVKTTCKENRLASVSVALLGSGVMEWSRERDRRINISTGRVEKGCDPSIQAADDVTRLAGALTRASLPAPNRVTVNGEKLS